MTQQEIEKKSYGRWGEMRKAYLMQEKPQLWQEMNEAQDVDAYLREIQQEMAAKAEHLTQEILQERKVTEAVKAENPMRWISEMEQAQKSTQEILQQELCR